MSRAAGGGGAAAVGAVAGALATMLLAAPRDASAQTWGYDDRGRYESRQHFAFELRIGNFIPRIDQQLGLERGPYWDIFSTCDTRNAAGNMCASPTTNRSLPFRPLFSVEFDWQFLRIGPVLSLGVGLSAGIAITSERAPFSATMSDPNPNTWTLSTEQTALSVVPMTGVLVARFDGLARHVRWLPLVPYIKGGLAYSFWWVTNASGIAQAPGSTGAQRDVSGGSLGFHVAGGLSLMLDVFEPSLARQFDAEMGVNHSYVFFELYLTELGAFSSSQLNVGTFSWAAGLMLEF